MELQLAVYITMYHLPKPTLDSDRELYKLYLVSYVHIGWDVVVVGGRRWKTGRVLLHDPDHG